VSEMVLVADKERGVAGCGSGEVCEEGERRGWSGGNVYLYV
jgi:hypothetical protein